MVPGMPSRSRKQSMLLGFGEGRWAQVRHKPIGQPVGEKIKGNHEGADVVVVESRCGSRFSWSPSRASPSRSSAPRGGP